jgi:surface polysaccharide O-acyltransferase-like enzyme
VSNDELRPPPPSTQKSGRDKLDPKPGLISGIIGSGEDAKNSIVYKTIAWSFLSGVLFSVVIIFYILYKGEGNPEDSIKNIWAIFIPVITLSLGYIFGKNK